MLTDKCPECVGKLLKHMSFSRNVYAQLLFDGVRHKQSGMYLGHIPPHGVVVCLGFVRDISGSVMKVMTSNGSVGYVHFDASDWELVERQ